MEISTYYAFEEFERSHLIQFVTYLKKIDEGILKISKPTLIDYYHFLDEFYIEKLNLLTDINSKDNNKDIQKVIIENFDKEKLISFSYHLDVDYWDVPIENLEDKTYYYSVRLKGNLNKISDFVQNKIFEYSLTNEVSKTNNIAEKQLQSVQNIKIPIYFDFIEFQSNFKIDFIQISGNDGSIKLSEYYESIKTNYDNLVKHFKNAEIDLRYLKNELSERKLEQLKNLDSTTPIRSNKKINEQIQKFNETYKLPLEITILGNNISKLEDFTSTAIKEMKRIIALIIFESRKEPQQFQNIKAEPVIINKEKDTDEKTQTKFTVPQIIKILDKLNIKGIMQDKGFTDFQTVELLADIFGRSEKTIRNNFDNENHTTTAEKYISELRNLKAKR